MNTSVYLGLDHELDFIVWELGFLELSFGNCMHYWTSADRSPKTNDPMVYGGPSTLFLYAFRMSSCYGRLRASWCECDSVQCVNETYPSQKQFPSKPLATELDDDDLCYEIWVAFAYDNSIFILLVCANRLKLRGSDTCFLGCALEATLITCKYV
jgi:hypothetical protein